MHIPVVSQDEETNFLRLIVIAALNIRAKRFRWMAAQFYGGAQAEIALTHTHMWADCFQQHQQQPLAYLYLRALILVVNFSASCARIYGHLRKFPISILSQSRYADHKFNPNDFFSKFERFY
jgi:hypothetical protein